MPRQAPSPEAAVQAVAALETLPGEEPGRVLAGVAGIAADDHRDRAVHAVPDGRLTAQGPVIQEYAEMVVPHLYPGRCRWSGVCVSASGERMPDPTG